MRNKFILVALIVYGIVRGVQYFFSPQFQDYGNRTKAPWTCQANLIIGGLYEIGSEYHSAYDVYENVLTRCPETPFAQEALFQKAVNLEGIHRSADALETYKAYLELYPEGERKVLATKSVNRIQLTR